MPLFKFFRFIFRKKKPKFEIGEQVNCIDDREHAIEYGRKYKILNIFECKCNEFCYDVGLKDIDTLSYTFCNVCKENIPGRGIRWAGEHRLEKYQEKKPIMEMIVFPIKKRKMSN